MEDEKNLKNEEEEKSITEEACEQAKDENDDSQKNSEVEQCNTADSVTIDEIPSLKDDAANGKNDENSSNSKLAAFFNNLSVSIVDTVIIGVISGILLYLCDFIMRYTVGLYISDKVTFSFIIFAIVTVLYPCFSETFGGKTPGKILMKIK